MRVLFVTGSLVHGGAERQSITLFNGFTERGHECHLLYVKNDPSQLPRLRPAGAGSVQCLHARRYLDSRSLSEAGALMRRLQPSVVLAVNPYALMYASLAARWARLRAPLVVTFHTTQVGSAKEWLQMLYYRPFFWHAACAVFVCEAQRRFWLRRGLAARSNAMIYNGIDIDHWRPVPEAERAQARAALGFAPEDLVIGMCAVLRPEKNPVQLVEAIAALRRRSLSAKALFIGDGVMAPQVEARSRSLGVAEDVRISGLQQEVRPLLGACDAVALCSTRIETFSLAALEAMALARPVVHSQIGGAAEMVREGENGFLFPVGDTAALIERLARLADARTRSRLGSRARQVLEEQFSEKAMLERYEKLLMELETTRSKRENLPKPARAH
jgi:glycosyltransferase involved in cell wall biosynthesis